MSIQSLVYVQRHIAAEDDSQAEQIREIFERVIRIEQREED